MNGGLTPCPTLRAAPSHFRAAAGLGGGGQGEVRGRRKPPPGTPLSCPGPPLWEVWPLGPGWGQAGSGGERSLVVCQGCVSCAQMWDLLCLSLERLVVTWTGAESHLVDRGTQVCLLWAQRPLGADCLWLNSCSCPLEQKTGLREVSPGPGGVAQWCLGGTRM